MSGAVARKLNTTSKRLGGKLAGPRRDLHRVQPLDERPAPASPWARSTARGRWRTCSSATPSTTTAACGSAPGALPDDGLFDVLADRQRHQGRPRPEPAQAVPRHLPAPPPRGAPARRGRDGRVVRAAADRARRRAARYDAGPLRGRARGAAGAGARLGGGRAGRGLGRRARRALGGRAGRGLRCGGRRPLGVERGFERTRASAWPGRPRASRAARGGARAPRRPAASAASRRSGRAAC